MNFQAIFKAVQHRIVFKSWNEILRIIERGNAIYNEERGLNTFANLTPDIVD